MRRKQVRNSAAALGIVLLGAGVSWSTIGSSHRVGATREQEETEPIARYGSYSCGLERWSVKTGTDANASRVDLRQVVSTNIISLRRLPAPGTLPSGSRVTPVETTIYRVRAILLRYKEETDSDYHLVIADTGGRTMIGEIPYPPCVGASSPFRAAISRARRTFNSRYQVDDQWHRVHVPVQITGVGFFDFQHGQSGVAPNAIELHPLLGISFGTPKTGTLPAPPAPPKGTTGHPSSRNTGSLSVRAWVSPSTVRYGSYPTLYASATRGATCYASVRYSTGSAPRSFSGYSQTIGSGGTVSWSWHMETSGTGGTATVTCSLGGTTRTTTASFSVVR